MIIAPFPCSSNSALAHATSPQRQRSASSLKAATIKQQERIQFSFSFNYGAACSSSNVGSFGFGCSFRFSDACTCSLAATALHSSGSSEQLSRRLMFRRQPGESHSSSLHLCLRSEGDLQRSLRICSETALSLSIFCVNSTQQPQPHLSQQQWPANCPSAAAFSSNSSDSTLLPSVAENSANLNNSASATSTTKQTLASSVLHCDIKAISTSDQREC